MIRSCIENGIMGVCSVASVLTDSEDYPGAPVTRIGAANRTEQPEFETILTNCDPSS